MGVRAIVLCLVAAGLALGGLALVGLVSTWGLDWVTIESPEPAPESTAEATPTTTEEPLPEPTVVIDFEVDERYPPASEWTVFDVPAALNIRAGPGTEHQRLGSAALGTSVTLTGQVVESPTSGIWVQVRSNNLTGWVFASYLTQTTTPASGGQQ